MKKSQLIQIIKEEISKQIIIEEETQKLDQLPKGKIFGDAKNIEGIFQKSKHNWNEVIEAFEKYKEHQQPTTINIRHIKITQPNIQANKVKNMLDKIDKLPPINVVEFEDGEKVIFDAHHRLVANWVLGRDKIKVNLVKINNLQEEINNVLNENVDMQVFDRMMAKYRKLKNSHAYESALEMLQDAVANGLTSETITYFSSDVISAPKKKLSSGHYNSYTPKGQGTRPNENFKSQLIAWKTEHLYPYFSAFGFKKADIDKAWKAFKSVHKL